MKRSTITADDQEVVLVFWQVEEIKKWYKFGSPILIVLGTVGNFLAVVTLQSRLFKSSTSTSFILTILALCEILIMYMSLLRTYLDAVYGIKIRSYSMFGCKFHTFLTYLSRQLASWTLVLLTVERFISVHFPFKCKQLCSRKRIVLAWLVIALVLSACDFHFFFSVAIYLRNYAEHMVDCDIVPSWNWFIVGPWYWIDTFLSDLLPFFVIIIGNVLIVTKLIRAQRARLTQMHAASEGTEKPKGTSSTTYVLILVSLVFLVTHIPLDVYFTAKTFGMFGQSTYEEYYNSNLVYAIVTIVYYMNSAVEFLLYFFSGRKFRVAFLDMFGIKKAKV